MGRAVFGSEQWIEGVFAAPDARKVAGRSRPTQRFAIAGSDGKPTYAEGGNESTSRGLMILGVNAGLIKRWKFQPFSMTKEEHSIEAVPDLIFQTNEEKVFVAEIRSARFQTADKLGKAKVIERVINGTASMQYVYWTDAWPLIPATTRLVRELRRCGTSDIPRDSIDALEKLLRDVGQTTVFELRERKCFRDVLMAAVWHGKAHIDLLSPVTDSTLVTANPYTRRFHELLNLRVGGQSWWQTLSRV